MKVFNPLNFFFFFFLQGNDKCSISNGFTLPSGGFAYGESAKKEATLSSFSSVYTNFKDVLNLRI